MNKVYSEDGLESPTYGKYFIYGNYVLLYAGVIVVFILAILLFLRQSTDVLVSSDKLSQCSNSSQIYTFPPTDRQALMGIAIYDADTNQQSIAYYTASWSGCGIDQVNSSTRFPAAGISRGMEKTFNPFEIGVDAYVDTEGHGYRCISQHDSEILAITDGSCLNPLGTYTPNPCFKLTCSGGTKSPSLLKEMPNFEYGLVKVTVHSYNSPYFAVVGSIIVFNKTVQASCMASVYGQAISYFSVSYSIQASGVHQCKVDETVVAALSSSFSYVMTAHQGLGVALAVLLVLYKLGPGGTLKYFMGGGKFTLEALISDT